MLTLVTLLFFYFSKHTGNTDRNMTNYFLSSRASSPPDMDVLQKLKNILYFARVAFYVQTV